MNKVDSPEKVFEDFSATIKNVVVWLRLLQMTELDDSARIEMYAKLEQIRQDLEGQVTELLQLRLSNIPVNELTLLIFEQVASTKEALSATEELEDAPEIAIQTLKRRISLAHRLRSSCNTHVGRQALIHRIVSDFFTGGNLTLQEAISIFITDAKKELPNPEATLRKFLHDLNVNITRFDLPVRLDFGSSEGVKLVNMEFYPPEQR